MGGRHEGKLTSSFLHDRSDEGKLTSSFLHDRSDEGKLIHRCGFKPAPVNGIWNFFFGICRQDVASCGLP